MKLLRSCLPLATTGLACILLSACGGAHQSQMRASAAVVRSAQPVDEYQAMALDAGRDLIGTKAPKLSLRTIDNRPLRPGEHHRPVYLKFWATWCVTCREQMPAFKADYARYGKDMDVVAVNTGVDDDRAKVEAYRRDVGLTMPIAIDDGRLAKAFHLRVTPQHVIIGRDGVIRYVGHLDDEQLQRELRAAIAGAPLQQSSGTRIADRESQSHDSRTPRSVLTSVQGTSVTIGASPGTPRLVYFLSPWCETYLEKSRPEVAGQCKDTREALDRLSASGKVRVIGIASALSTDTAGVRRFIKRTGFNVPIVFDQDGDLFRQFGIHSFPTVVRLDSSGQPVARLDVRELNTLAGSAHA